MKLKLQKNSIIILICSLSLAMFGCVMVYSASKNSAFIQYGNEFFYLKKQVMGVAIGVVGSVGVGIELTLCTLTFVVPLGQTLNFLSNEIVS